MSRLFGTDGIRGVANETLDCSLAFRVGQATAITLARVKNSTPTVVIGTDTRISSDMLENALLAGLCSCGCNAVRLGVIPTPAVAYLTVFYHADAGIVISASHNPYEYNGIKIFSSEGFKLRDELEDEIETLVLSEEALPAVTHNDLGRTVDAHHASAYYIRHLASTVEDISDLRVLIDCANGAASQTAQRLFRRFDMDVTLINDNPDGVNINDHCGSTHLEMLSESVKAGYYDLGIAFDGDADRCLIVDENGREVDGDIMMAICARALQAEGKLQKDGFVATVMSNLGLHKYCREHGLKLLCANVGDRNVLELMQKENMVLGGEQSGHIIFLEHMTTGDGQLAALQFLRILCRSGKTVSQLAAEFTRYPQVLINVPAPHDNAAKRAILDSHPVQEAIRKEEVNMGRDGRILVRPSGTEALIRVMVEASEEEKAKQTADRISDVIKNQQK